MKGVDWDRLVAFQHVEGMDDAGLEALERARKDDPEIAAQLERLARLEGDLVELFAGFGAEMRLDPRQRERVFEAFEAAGATPGIRDETADIPEERDTVVRPIWRRTIVLVGGIAAALVAILAIGPGIREEPYAMQRADAPAPPEARLEPEERKTGLSPRQLSESEWGFSAPMQPAPETPQPPARTSEKVADPDLQVDGFASDEEPVPQVTDHLDESFKHLEQDAEDPRDLLIELLTTLESGEWPSRARVKAIGRAPFENAVGETTDAKSEAVEEIWRALVAGEVGRPEVLRRFLTGNRRQDEVATLRTRVREPSRSQEVLYRYAEALLKLESGSDARE